MGWNPENRYKFLGKLIQSNGELFFAFDLTEPEVFQLEDSCEHEKRRSRIPQYVAEWKDQFGVPYEEHKKLQMITFDEYTVFSLSDKQMQKAPVAEQKPTEPVTQGNADRGTGGTNVFRTI